MNDNISKSFGVIILAAGKGKRIQAKAQNKVTMRLADKPMILHAMNLLDKIPVSSIIVVVGFAKDSVMKIIQNPLVTFAEQRKRLGTAHAVSCALKKLPSQITDVLIIQGDDAAFYTEDTIKKLMQKHIVSQADGTLLTITVKNPFGLGRIVRNKSGNIEKIVEEKNAADDERAIMEINPACYIFSVNFLKNYLPKIKKNEVTGEYYLPEIINLGLKDNKNIQAIHAGVIPWRGINTEEELLEAEKLFYEINRELYEQ